MKFLAKPTPHKDAVKFLRAAPAVDRQTFNEMLPEFQHGAFLITGIHAHDALQDIRDIVEETQNGGDFEEIRKRIEKAMEPHLGTQARRRSLMVVRAWAFRASSAGIVRQLDNHGAAFPFRKRLSAGDGRVRDSHRAMHGMVLPADSPFWDAHTPPDAHNCRCTVVGITRAQAGRLAAQEAADVAAGTMLPEERRLPDAAIQKQQGGGIINRGMAQQFNLNKEPGSVDWSPRSLLMPVAQIKERYTPDVFARFEAWAKMVKPDGKVTLWDRLNAQRDGLPRNEPAAIQPALPLPGTLPKARTREEVRKALKLPDIKVTPPPPPPVIKKITPPPVKVIEKKILPEKPAPVVPVAPAARLDAIKKTAADFAARVKAARLAGGAAVGALNSEALAAVQLPPAERGALPLKPGTKFLRRWVKHPDGSTSLDRVARNAASAKLVKAAQAGASLLSTVVHKDFLPQNVEVNAKSGRASCSIYMNGATMNVSLKTTVRTHAHEAAHAVESLNPDVIRQALAFRAKRTAGESPQKLSKLTGNAGYRFDEVAMEDEWVKRGGHHYAGKVYPGERYSEIITMGVERLLFETAEFAADDPDYFLAMVTILQKL